VRLSAPFDPDSCPTTVPNGWGLAHPAVFCWSAVRQFEEPPWGDRVKRPTGRPPDHYRRQGHPMRWRNVPGFRALWPRGGLLSKRTIFSLVIALVFVLLSWISSAQPADKITRIGFLSVGSGPSQYFGIFVQRIGELGHVEGKNLVIEKRWATERTIARACGGPRRRQCRSPCHGRDTGDSCVQ
jgi:hypothetical protein